MRTDGILCRVDEQIRSEWPASLTSIGEDYAEGIYEGLGYGNDSATRLNSAFLYLKW